MNILLISYHFAPQNVIGAVRPTKFAKYLTKMGHEVTVICGRGMSEVPDPLLLDDLQSLQDVHVVEENNWLKRYQDRKKQATTPASSSSPVAQNQAKTRTGLKHRIMDTVYISLRKKADASFQIKACAFLKTLKEKQFDVVFSSYGPISVHHIARFAKKQGIAKRWVADFRDEVSAQIIGGEQKKLAYLRMIAKEADLMTGVAHDIMDSLQGESRWLPNGFDLEDQARIAPLPKADKPPYEFFYCGQFAGNDRTMVPIFNGIAKLMDQNLCKRSDIRLVYAGRQGSLFEKQATQCGLGDLVINHGLVSRDRAVALQMQADVLMFASRYPTDQSGVIPGKFLEYMMADKPILCCMSGTVAESEPKQMLVKTGLGFCYEAANAKHDEGALDQYLQTLLHAMQNKQNLLPEKNEEAIASFSYDQLAKQLMAWLS